MALINVDPNAEASASFDIARPGIYRLRIEGSENMPAATRLDSKKTPGNVCLRIRAVFADPTSVYKVNGDPAKLLGSIIDNSLLIEPKERQGKLRSMVEAVGLEWTNFDSDDLNGREFNAKVDVEEYNGEQKNVIRRYLKAGA